MVLKVEGSWNEFWKKKGSKMEWKKEDVLESKELKEILEIMKSHLRKSNDKISLIELGAGMGITSLFFAHQGVKVTLLDKSPEAKGLAKEYWDDIEKHEYILGDLFTFSSKKKYDVVTSYGLCEHFVEKNRELVLKKHIELLDKKGVALISVPHKYGIFYRISKKIQETLGYWDFGLEVPFSKNELINFANRNKLNYEIIMSGFYGSAYDLFVRKPLKVLNISSKRRFDSTKSIFDDIFGSGLLIILKKG
ncbi:MAG: class I SAM-dependent methyltransferase [Nanoarchaeota archaeon]